MKLLPILRVSTKPIETEAYIKDNLPVMVRMLNVFTEQRKKPIAIFCVSPTSPLTFSEAIVQNIIDCANLGLPIEFIGGPHLGATAPVTVLGGLVQYHAEILAGITMTQLVRKGSKVIYGGAPMSFDMRYCTTPLTSPEAMLVSTMYVEIAKYFKIPTEMYLGLSDSKRIDYQAGLETGFGILIALLKGTNVVTGPGMLEYASVQSILKLVIDAEVIDYMRMYVRELELTPEQLALDAIREVGPRGTYLTLKHTIKYMRKELYHPKLLDRLSRTLWEKEGKPTLEDKARKIVENILQKHKPNTPPEDLDKELIRVVKEVATGIGYSLPDKYLAKPENFLRGS